jgi:hypothetical protein
VFHAAFSSTRLRAFIQSIAVRVANGYDLQVLAILDEAPYEVYVSGAASANANETDADAVIGAQDTTSADEGKSGR